MLDLTINEQRALGFLCIGFVAGLCVWIYKERFEPLPPISVERPGRISSQGHLNTDISTRENRHDRKRNNQEERDVFKININHASHEELIRLPGIGPVMARKIIEYRRKHGPFYRTADLVKVKGIGVKKLNKIKHFIDIDPMKEE